MRMCMCVYCVFVYNCIFVADVTKLKPNIISTNMNVCI